jgi:hypothetical protein
LQREKAAGLHAWNIIYNTLDINNLFGTFIDKYSMEICNLALYSQDKKSLTQE